MVVKKYYSFFAIRGVGNQMEMHIVSIDEKTWRSGEHGSETTNLYIENIIIKMVIVTCIKNSKHLRSRMKQQDFHSFLFCSFIVESTLNRVRGIMQGERGAVMLIFFSLKLWSISMVSRKL
jgi:hypothetical protein